ncbi:PUSL1 protein, partial [Sylvia borin]|nr:PUSL1 protein [Sylvia borin]
QEAAQKLKPSAPIKFHISSRTDTGVHALANAAHLDIQRAPGKAPFTAQQLVQGLNYHLRPEPIRILSAQRVPGTFHARFCALSRTYIYRLLLGCAHHSQIPVFERDLCWAPAGGSPLQISETSKRLVFELEKWEFLALSGQNHPRAAAPFSRGFFFFFSLIWELEFWEVKVKGRSFLYRQVK